MPDNFQVPVPDLTRLLAGVPVPVISVIFFLNSLTALFEAAGAAVHVGPLPEIRGDVQQLASLCHHLLLALLALRLPAARQTIEVSAVRTQDGWQMRWTANNTAPPVSDGEIAFPMMEPGNGNGNGHPDAPTLGLALCRKIVHLHGGRMWADTQVDGVARLVLDLPAITG